MILTADATTNPCSVHGYHQPAPVWTHRHHVILKSWTDRLGLPESRTVLLCPHGHDALHAALHRALSGMSYTAGAAIRALVDEAVAWYNDQPEHLQDPLVRLAAAEAHW